MAAISTTEVHPHTTPVALALPVKLSWGAIFGAGVVVIAGYLLLMSLGLAVALTAIDPARPETAKTGAIIVGVWSLASSLVALFVGGMVAARTAGIVDRVAGSIHGAVVWGLATIFTVYLLMSGVRSIAGTAVDATSGAVSTAGTTIDPLMQTLGIGTDDLVDAVNRQLRQEGKPNVTAPQVQAAARDAAQTALVEGRIDRQLFVSALVENTALSQEGARDIVARVESAFGQRSRAFRSSAVQSLLRAADQTGDVMWWISLGLALGLGAAMAGAGAGVSRRQRALARGSRATLGDPEEAPSGA